MQEVPLQNNVKAIRPTSRGSLTRAIPMYRTGTPAINRSDATLLDYEEHPSPLGQDTVPGSVENKEADLPELSWFMTVLILVVVSVVRTKHALRQRMGILIGSFTDGRHHCQMGCDNSERECCKQVCQQGVDGSHSFAFDTGDRRYVSDLNREADRDTFFFRLRRRCQRLGQGSTDD